MCVSPPVSAETERGAARGGKRIHHVLSGAPTGVSAREYVIQNERGPIYVCTSC